MRAAWGLECGQGGLKSIACASLAVNRGGRVVARWKVRGKARRRVLALTVGRDGGLPTKDGNSMRRPVARWTIVLVLSLVASIGCVPTQPFYLHEDGDLSHYLDKQIQAEYPDLSAQPLADVAQSLRPLSLAHPDFKEFWELTLQECVAIGLLNTKIIRGGTASRLQNGQIFAGTQEGALVLNTVGRFVTTYDAAIVESNPGQQIGGLSNFFLQQNAQWANSAFNGSTTDGGVAGVRQGVEAALSLFDAQLSITSDPTSGLRSSTVRPQNIRNVTAIFPSVQSTRQGGWDATISKRTAEGTMFSATSSTDFIAGNFRGFPTNQPLFGTWTQVLQLEARHPLLRGRGSQINRMPVMIARIGTDIELANVQANVQDMLNNLEIRYWDLYLAYRNVETAKVSRDSSLITWRIVFDKFISGVEPVQAEAQAQEQYYNFRASLEAALRNLYDVENELRFLMGLSASDGRLIRPKDDPTLARVEFDWTEIMAEAIARRPELNIRRWQIKQRELELILARNQLLPQFDIGAQYRWVGVGDTWWNANRSGEPVPGVGIDASAWQSLTGGDFQEFSLLGQFQMPIGFRRELAGVRHAQLRLAREKAVLDEAELDVSHGLAHALRNLETNFELSQTNGNRWNAAQRDVEAREALYKGGRVALDDVLQAQQRRAVAQAAFWSAVIEYNKSIADLHTRKGSIMDYDGIGFDEGPWPQKAYWDALARARERDAGWYIDYGWTRPRVISRGPIAQGLPTSTSSAETTQPTPAEELPEPTPAQPREEADQVSPLPPPQTPQRPVVPLNTRNELPAAVLSARRIAAVPGSETSGDETPGDTAQQQQPAMPFGIRPRSRATVSPASYYEEGDERSNPLRRQTRPVGTGVVTE
jgi:outer membrane protein TolC